MISFNCTCGKIFKVPDDYAGRSAKCKICGNMVKVPVPAEPVLAVVGSAGENPSLADDVAPMAEVRESMMDDAEPAAEELADQNGHSMSDYVPSASQEAAPEEIATEQPEPQTISQRLAPSIPDSPAPRRIPMRIRRLRADADAMATAFRSSAMIHVEPMEGDPPEAYHVRYQIDSLEPGPEGKPLPRSEHEIEIHLTSEYPRLSPRCKILTPIFHPNFDPTTICVGDHWTAGERLVDLVIRIGEMIAYQAYNIQSPLDGHAAMWADLNRGLLPTDNRDLRPVDFE